MSFKNKVNISVLISLLCVILLLFVFCAYASDNSTVISNGTDINTTSVNNTNEGIREVNVHNYGELKDAVDNLTAGPCEKLVINLEDGDYKINTKIIHVKSGQNVVINGNGHTIDCNYKCFMDITNGGNVTINSLQVKKAEVDGDGGAIYNTGTLTVHDSTFTDNKADCGGAIYNTGTLTVHDSTFNNNHAANGGSIYNTGTLTVTGSTFNNNIANSNQPSMCEGGAIKCTGNNNPLIVTDCQFIGNCANSGGAIYARVLEIQNCVFTENKASNTVIDCYGGAVTCNDLNKCHDCNFTSNTADNGGAIAIMQKAGINHIKDCIFKDNQATAHKISVNGKGGAIFVNEKAAHISLVHNQFINNYATKKGDNVYNFGHYDKIEHNYFPHEDQNKFREWGFFKDKNHKDNSPFDNLDDYYKWKG